ncbi:IclR family transcriptional regulator [Microbacterium trichothecenolyticum]|uniref:DNA-binding IclR family transcriptional regulator n=1 Tax=Microbacterium trichothecenolyticum TaxID=69370 RepID=A0ABU0TXY7_MICTR|nr:IclR family transcriptional regulator [Microbacterium trichothecenolyticum]MDQ1124499.1 DNA-binding IclR family transcriptional regulator [Microbacterium trichothecenolyticum]
MGDDVNEHSATATAVPVVEARTKGVDSARRALQILLRFTEDTPELTVDALRETYDISQASAYRYVSLLREMNLVEERAKGIFVLTPRVARLGRVAEGSFDYRAVAQPVVAWMRDRTGETAQFQRRVNDAAVCVAVAESDHPVRLSFQPGHPMPLHSGAVAKVLLAFQPVSVRTTYLDRLRPHLAKAARSQLERDLETIRETGYAQSAGEVDEGVWAFAAPVRSNDVLLGAVTVAAPDYRVSDARKSDIAAVVHEGAARLSRILEAAL